MEVNDYLHDADGDLIIRDGDFAKGESTEQNQADLLCLCPGELKAEPTSGVGIVDMLLNESSKQEVESVINDQFVRDGNIIVSIEIINSENANIEAYYEKDNN